jgi:hypothetical protein
MKFIQFLRLKFILFCLLRREDLNKSIQQAGIDNETKTEVKLEL